MERFEIRATGLYRTEQGERADVFAVRDGCAFGFLNPRDGAVWRTTGEIVGHTRRSSIVGPWDGPAPRAVLVPDGEWLRGSIHPNTEHTHEN